MPDNQTLTQRDLKHLWHPCTQMKDHEWLPMIPIRSGHGVWLEDFDGKRYLDAISSWWVNLFGHTHPYINEKLRAQSQQLEHTILAGFTHEPIIELSERLVGLTPDGLERCFYADNGSSAIEVALKMSFHYWRNQGKTGKTRFVTLSNSYHGETLGALAVGDVALYKETYEPLLMRAITVPSPDNYECPAEQTIDEYIQLRITQMRETFERHAGQVCAVLVEPLVQCAGSMRMYEAQYLTLLRQLCDEYEVHLIADEIAVGFGRSGTLFACEQAGISPDILCLSKGLTGGYLPLSVAMTTDKIYQAFYDDYQNLTAFLHSHSYTGNALACSTALATLDLFEQSPVLQDNQLKARLMFESVSELLDHTHIADIRQTGMILAIEMVRDRTTREAYAWQERRGLRVYQHGLANGVLLRPLGNVVYFMPPYVINEEQIAHMTKTAIEGIHLATKGDG